MLKPILIGFVIGFLALGVSRGAPIYSFAEARGTDAADDISSDARVADARIAWLGGTPLSDRNAFGLALQRGLSIA